MSNGAELDDTSLRTWAVVMAVNQIAGLPSWRRPASPLPMATALYDFVRAGRERGSASLHAIPGTGGEAA